MKSPEVIALHLQRQWQRSRFRQAALTTPDAWPRRYTIGLPSASELTTRAADIRRHIIRWQAVQVGEVVWREVNYRASSEAVRLPSHWILERPSDWVRACADRQVLADYGLLESLAGQLDEPMRDALIANIKLLRARSHEELQLVVSLAKRLKPGEAQGRPLRLLAGHGVDTKFFERNRQLLVRLLDARFSGEVSARGLHEFLDASVDGEHWLLLVPLQEGLLPFKQQQVSSQELSSMEPDVCLAKRILIVENRQCWHQLPPFEDTLAILGSGLDLEWLNARWLDDRDIAYWGDMDTWGLVMLARARQHRPGLKALLMNQRTFDTHAAGNAVVEPVTADEAAPDGLDTQEQSFYHYLHALERGRLEQEFLPVEALQDALRDW